jgi:Uma2 family endonuclease
MTASPHHGHLLTIDDYLQLAENDEHRWELQEGSLVMSPRPALPHMVALLDLAMMLRSQLPGNQVVAPDVDVDLCLVPPDQPGSVRAPDLVVVSPAGADRVYAHGGLVRADEVLLVVEIVSPGSRRMDRVIKRAEYADAGVPHYWIVDLDEPISLTICHLAGEFGYQDSGSLTGVVELTEPFPLCIDLTELEGHGH